MNKTIHKKHYLTALLFALLLSPLVINSRIHAQTTGYDYENAADSTTNFAIRRSTGCTPNGCTGQSTRFQFVGSDSEGYRFEESGGGSAFIVVPSETCSRRGFIFNNENDTGSLIPIEDTFEFTNLFDLPDAQTNCPDAGASPSPTAGSTGTSNPSGPTSTAGGTGAQQDDVPPAPEAVGVFNHSNEAYEASNCKTDGAELNDENCRVLYWINVFINALTVIFGVIAVVMIGVGGVQYSFARDNPQQSAAAKERIRNVIIAIVAYVFIYGFIQYIVPGGVL